MVLAIGSEEGLGFSRQPFLRPGQPKETHLLPSDLFRPSIPHCLSPVLVGRALSPQELMMELMSCICFR